MTHHIRPIELLAPAKDITCGIEAINHGADAVYIGAPRFSARAAAPNSLHDISSLCDYAHRFGARIYVALNTILTDAELEDSRRLAWQLYDAGADALIVQDLGLTQLDLPPIPLHASTQMDNRTPAKVQFLQEAGFRQIVLARELSLEEIRRISAVATVPLEVFIHGALCVSFSGQCYLSQALAGRSANRGSCAQFCRLPYTMTDADGRVILRDKHLLSLRDLCQAGNLEPLLDAGVSSLKIEGRLKDVSYVKNVTAYYRQQLDQIFARRQEFVPASDGHCDYTFRADLRKSFNRGFTDFFLHGRQRDITAFDSPKSVGEPVGHVKEIRGKSIVVAGTTAFNNGDGLVFFTPRGEMQGFRINRVEGNRIFPAEMPRLAPRTPLFRNFDQAFERLLSKPSAERRIPVSISFTENNFGFTLTMEDASGARVMLARPLEKQLAKRDQLDTIRTQLAKLGNTPFSPGRIDISLSAPWFLPASFLADMRREAVERLLSVRKMRFRRELTPHKQLNNKPIYPETTLTYLGNVSNREARRFYTERGVRTIEPAFELQPRPGVPLMFTKHCLRYSLGWCPTHQHGKSPFREPYYIMYRDTRLRLTFDCRRCQMIISEEKEEKR